MASMGEHCLIISDYESHSISGLPGGLSVDFGERRRRAHWTHGVVIAGVACYHLRLLAFLDIAFTIAVRFSHYKWSFKTPVTSRSVSGNQSSRISILK